jgi:hypothetical protein
MERRLSLLSKDHIVRKPLLILTALLVLPVIALAVPYSPDAGNGGSGDNAALLATLCGAGGASALYIGQKKWGTSPQDYLKVTRSDINACTFYKPLQSTGPRIEALTTEPLGSPQILTSNCDISDYKIIKPGVKEPYCKAITCNKGIPQAWCFNKEGYEQVNEQTASTLELSRNDPTYMGVSEGVGYSDLITEPKIWVPLLLIENHKIITSVANQLLSPPKQNTTKTPGCIMTPSPVITIIPNVTNRQTVANNTCIMRPVTSGYCSSSGAYVTTASSGCNSTSLLSSWLGTGSGSSSSNYCSISGSTTSSSAKKSTSGSSTGSLNFCSVSAHSTSSSSNYYSIGAPSSSSTSSSHCSVASTTAPSKPK